MVIYNKLNKDHVYIYHKSNSENKKKINLKKKQGVPPDNCVKPQLLCYKKRQLLLSKHGHLKTMLHHQVASPS